VGGWGCAVRDDGVFQQIALAPGGQRFPARPVTVPGQALQRIGIGQGTHLPPIQPGTLDQVLHITKGLVFSRCHDAARPPPRQSP
jgi:hypothetical protein